MLNKAIHGPMSPPGSPVQGAPMSPHNYRAQFILVQKLSTCLSWMQNGLESLAETVIEAHKKGAEQLEAVREKCINETFFTINQYSSEIGVSLMTFVSNRDDGMKFGWPDADVEDRYIVCYRNFGVDYPIDMPPVFMHVVQNICNIMRDANSIQSDLQDCVMNLEKFQDMLRNMSSFATSISTGLFDSTLKSMCRPRIIAASNAKPGDVIAAFAEDMACQQAGADEAAGKVMARVERNAKDIKALGKREAEKLAMGREAEAKRVADLIESINAADRARKRDRDQIAAVAELVRLGGDGTDELTTSEEEEEVYQATSAEEDDEEDDEEDGYVPKSPKYMPRSPSPTDQYRSPPYDPNPSLSPPFNPNSSPSPPHSPLSPVVKAGGGKRERTVLVKSRTSTRTKLQANQTTGPVSAASKKTAGPVAASKKTAGPIAASASKKARK